MDGTHPQPPDPLPEQGDPQQACPGHVDDIPQVFHEALGIQVLARAAQAAVRARAGAGGVFGAGYLLEVRLDERRGEREQDVPGVHRGRRRAAVHEQPVHAEECVHAGRDGVERVQRGGIAPRNLLRGFLLRRCVSSVRVQVCGCGCGCRLYEKKHSYLAGETHLRHLGGMSDYLRGV